MEGGVARWQWILLSGGLLEPAGGRRTVRDWIVDVVMIGVAVGSGVWVLASTWERHSLPTAIADVVLGSIACAALWVRRERALPVDRKSVV